MNIEIDLKELKLFKKVTKCDFIKITAKKDYIELYTKDYLLEVLKKVDDVIVIEPGEFIIQSYLLDVLPPGIMKLTSAGLDSTNIFITFKDLSENIKYKEFELEKIITNDFKTEILKEILDVKHAISKDKTRAVIQNICLRENDAVALDGYRLSKRFTGLNLKEDIYIPREIVKILSRIKSENNSIALQGNSTILKLDNYFMRFVKNCNDEFIDYNCILKSDTPISCSIIVDSKIFLNILKRANKLNQHMVCLEVMNNNAELKVERFDIDFKERLQADCTGEIKIGLNINYLIDSFKALQGEVRFEFKSPVAPVTIIQNNKTELVLPIRISK